MSRVKNKKKLFGEDFFDFTKEEMRFGTPEIIADFRAEKLKCNSLLEVGCGVGFQTIAFARTCKKVIAVDIDGEKVARAKKNLACAGLNNVVFVIGDILDEKVQDKIPFFDAVFLDPERPAQEVERSLENIRPDLEKFVVFAKKITKNICIEIPPHLRKFPDFFKGAKLEFVSLNHKINRAHLIFGEGSGFRAVMLPQGVVCEDAVRSELKTFPCCSEKVNWTKVRFVSEIDPALAFAGLDSCLPEVRFVVKNKVFCLGESFLKIPFATSYKVSRIFDCENDLICFVKFLKAGRIVQHNLQLRLRCASGFGNVHVFRIFDKFLVSVICMQEQ